MRSLEYRIAANLSMRGMELKFIQYNYLFILVNTIFFWKI